MKKKLIIASIVLGIIGVVATGAANWIEYGNRFGTDERNQS